VDEPEDIGVVFGQRVRDVIGLERFAHGASTSTTLPPARWAIEAIRPPK